jgi:hypothetical protein
VPFRIETPEQRAALDPRDKPYYQRIGPGLHIGYRKGKNGASWVVRWKEGRSYRTRTIKNVAPDDFNAGHCVRQISYREAVAVAMDEGTYYCSFCKKSSKEVGKLVAGPNVFICDECVRLSQHYIDNGVSYGRGKLELDQDNRPVLDGSGQPVFSERNNRT